jgi:hypothetical protein
VEAGFKRFTRAYLTGKPSPWGEGVTQVTDEGYAFPSEEAYARHVPTIYCGWKNMQTQFLKSFLK